MAIVAMLSSEGIYGGKTRARARKTWPSVRLPACLQPPPDHVTVCRVPVIRPLSILSYNDPCTQMWRELPTPWFC